MIDAKAHYEKLNDLYNEIKKDYDEVRKLESASDRELSDKYHEIEKTTFNVVQGYRFAMDIKSILQKRRAIKGESAKMRVIMDLIEKDEMMTTMNSRLQKAAEKHGEILASLNYKEV